MQEVRNRRFNHQRIVLDNKQFISCTFVECTMEYQGKGEFGLIDNTFEGMPKVIFSGAAGSTLKALKGLYHGGFQELVEITINDIRSSAPPDDHSGIGHQAD